MSESKVQIAPDNTTGGYHAVRTETVLPIDPSQSLTTAEQQVVSIGDNTGNLVDVTQGGSMMVADHTTHQLLRGLILRLDILNSALDRNYQPPDDLYGETGI